MAQKRGFSLRADREEDLPTAAVALGSKACRMAVRVPSKPAEPTRFFARQLDPDQDRAAALAALWAEAGLEQARLTLVLPRRDALVRVLDLPTEDDAEINAMTHLQGPLLLPYAADTAVYGVYVKRRSQGSAAVDLVAVARDRLEEYLGWTEAAGLAVDDIVFEPIALAAAYAAAAEGAAVFVDVDGDGVDLGLLQDGVLVFSHSLFLPGETDAIAAEIIRMIWACRREGQAVEPQQVLVGGAVALRERVAAGIQQELGLKTDLLEQPVIDGAGDVSFSAVDGALQEGVDTGPDLMPPTRVAARRRLQWRRSLVQTGVLAVLVLGLFWGLIEKQLANQQAYLRAIQAETAAIAPQVARVRGQQDALDAVRQVRDPQFSVLEVLKDLARVMPQGMFIDAFSFEVGRRVELSGSAVSMSGVFQALVPVLNDSPRFYNVSVNSVTKGRNDEEVIFQLEIPLTGAGGGGS